MDRIKYKYWELNNGCASGSTNLKECIGKLVDVNGYTVLLCTNGYAIINLNSKRYRISRGNFIVFQSDMPFIPEKVSAGFKARYVSVSYTISDNISYKIASELWSIMYHSPVLYTYPEYYRLIFEWYNQTDWILEHCCNNIEEMFQNSLFNLLMGINYEIKRLGLNDVSTYPRSKTWKFVVDFYALLNRYHTKHHDVKFYADKLNITPDYLYKLIYRTDKISPKEMIDRQIIVTIKTYLQSTDLSVKNIACELNFDDPSYMCRFFRRMTGFSPIQFRENRK